MQPGIGAWSGLVACLLVSGCEPRPEGFAWDVTLLMIEDECNDPPVPYEDDLRYVLDFVGSDVTIALGLAPWGKGTIAGCSLSYSSPLWSEERDGHALTWEIDGEATVRQGGSACGLEAGVDWDGIETITIVSSDHPDIATGCRYVTSVRGEFKGEL